MFHNVTQVDQCQKQANQKILQRDAVVEPWLTAEGQSSVHFQQIQYLEK
jgi:hypothetical protein